MLHPIVAFTQALDQLEEEHIKLKFKLEEFVAINETVREGKAQSDWFATLRELKTQVEIFMGELQQHATWEEQALFPMVGLYAEENRSILEVIEGDHLLAEQYLQAFLNELSKTVAPVNQKKAEEIMTLLMSGNQLLLDHFTEEEHHVFPLADEIKKDIDYLSS